MNLRIITILTNPGNFKSTYLLDIAERFCDKKSLILKIFNYSTVFTVPSFTAIATTVTVPFFSLTVRSVKRTEPLILTVRFLVFDREPYRTKVGALRFAVTH